MHRERSLKATPWSGCLYVLGLVLYSTTPLAADTGDADPPSAEAKTEKERVILPEMTVTATPGRETGYRVSNAATATKTDTPIFDSPFSVQVVPEQVFKDQRSSTIKDALENVSGVRSHSNEVEGYVFNIRGFRTLEIFRNGLAFSDAIPTIHETANLESLEVLKGPASILFGRIEPGGIIHKTTKRPLDVPYYSLEQEFGSYDHYRTIWDATGPLTGDRSLAYRLSGAYQDSASFRDFQEQQRFFISPSLLWRPTDATELKVDVEYLNNDAQSDTGFPALGDRPAPIPLSRSFQEPNDPLDETWSALVGYQLTHRLNDAWTIHNRFHAAWANLYKNNVLPVSIQADGRTLDRNINYQELPGEVYATNLDLTGKFDLLGSRHDVLAGLDYYYDYYDYSSTSLADVPVSNPGFPGHSGNSHDPEISIDIFNPRYGGVDPSKFISVLTDPARKGFSTFAREQYGVYFQDHITFFDQLHILGGGRYDWADNEGTFSRVSLADAKASVPARNEDEEFSPRVGVLYQPWPWPWIGVYGSWSNSFGANNGRTASGVLVPPETGVQWETGLKTQFFGGALSATLAFYHLTKENVLTEDLSTPDDPDDVIPIGESRSQGIEIDVFGQITDELGIIGSYAYTDADVTKDNSGLEGKELQNVPLHSGSAFLTYEFKNYQALNGLRLGFGAFAVGNRQGDTNNTFILPGYVRLDTFAAYSLNVGPSRVTAQLNIENLADKDYFEGTDVYFNSGGRLGIFPGAPLTVIGSLRVEF